MRPGRSSDGSSYAGGLVGVNNDDGGTIENAYATGTVSDSDDISGEL